MLAEQVGLVAKKKARTMLAVAEKLAIADDKTVVVASSPPALQAVLTELDVPHRLADSGGSSGSVDVETARTLQSGKVNMGS